MNTYSSRGLPIIYNGSRAGSHGSRAGDTSGGLPRSSASQSRVVAVQDARVDAPASRAGPRARVPAVRALFCFIHSPECSQLSEASGSVRQWARALGRRHGTSAKSSVPASPSPSPPSLSSSLLSPLSIVTIDGVVAVVADNPPEKNLMGLGMREDGGTVST